MSQTRRSDQSALVEAGYVVYCSGEGGDEGGGKKGQGGVGLALLRDIIRAQKHSPEFISDRLLKVTLELCGRARAVTFVVGYAPTDTQTASKKALFLNSFGQSREGGARTRTAVCVDRYQRTKLAARRGGIWK